MKERRERNQKKLLDILNYFMVATLNRSTNSFKKILNRARSFLFSSVGQGFHLIQILKYNTSSAIIHLQQEIQQTAMQSQSKNITFYDFLVDWSSLVAFPCIVFVGGVVWRLCGNLAAQFSKLAVY